MTDTRQLERALDRLAGEVHYVGRAISYAADRVRRADGVKTDRATVRALTDLTREVDGIRRVVEGVARRL